MRDEQPAAAQLRQQLPPDAELVSFGPVDHRFTYYYRDPIPEHTWPTEAAQVDGEVVYFCYDLHKGDTSEVRLNGRGLYWEETPGTLPFAWEPVAELNADRTHETDPEVRVVIGRILRTPGSVAELEQPVTESTDVH